MEDTVLVLRDAAFPETKTGTGTVTASRNAPTLPRWRCAQLTRSAVTPCGQGPRSSSSQASCQRACSLAPRIAFFWFQ